MYQKQYLGLVRLVKRCKALWRAHGLTRRQYLIVCPYCQGSGRLVRDGHTESTQLTFTLTN